MGRIKALGHGAPTVALAGAAALAITWIMRARPQAFGLYGPDTYWSSFWAIDYRDGFENRGLLGEIIRRFGVEEPSYLIITILAWAVFLTLVVVMIGALARITRNLEMWTGAALCFAVMMSPAMHGILIETMGDPIVLVLLVHILIAPYLLSERAPVLLSAAVYASLGVIMVLIHEGSIFFVIPWLAVQTFLVRKTAPSRIALIANTLASLLVVGLIVANGYAAGADDYVGRNRSDNPILHFGDQQTFCECRIGGSFSVLLQEELPRIFGNGVKGYIQTAARLAGATLLPVALAIVLVLSKLGAGADGRAAWRTHAIAFLGPMICIAPLLLIAADWGRFFSYELMLFIATLSAMAPQPARAEAPSSTILLGVAGVLVLAGLTTTPVLADYRMDGLFSAKYLMLVCMLVIGLFGSFILLDRKASRPS